MFILAIIVLTLVVVTTVIIIGNALTYNQSSRYSVSDVQAINLAEAGIDKAVASLNTTAGVYTGEVETNFGSGSYSVAITSIDSSNKIITATGYLPNKTKPIVKRAIQIQVVKGAGVSFVYGVQVGEGGIQLNNNARIVGSIYSNSSINMSNNSQITGDAYVAGGVQPAADQQSDCTVPNCTDFIFGKTANSQLDVAQGFKPVATAVINKVSLKLKKVGTPPDATVRILGDSSGKPNKNNVLTSGTLSANLVTNQYGFVDVTFSSTPSLTAETPYWILIDTSANVNYYWTWSQDTTQGYTRGGSAWSPNWQASSPVWTTIAGDLGFKTFMGGVATFIQGSNGASIGGNAYANTINNINITGGAYYQLISGVTAGSYHPGSADPTPKVLPVSDANIQAWKDQASGIGTYTGNISSCQATLNAGKYVGNISLTNNCIATMTDPIWITGDLSLDNGAQLKLKSTYGAASGIIVVDGKITLHNNGQLKGSGTSGSYLLGLSNFDSRTNGITAIDADNGSTTSIFYANNGIIFLHNNASLHEVSGWKIVLDNNAIVTYDSGLAQMFFTSGPSGNFSVIKGTYQNK